MSGFFTSLGTGLSKIGGSDKGFNFGNMLMGIGKLDSVLSGNNRFVNLSNQQEYNNSLKSLIEMMKKDSANKTAAQNVPNNSILFNSGALDWLKK